MFFVFSTKEHFYFGILYCFFTVFNKKRIDELNLVYLIQIGATVTSKYLLKVKTRRCTIPFRAHCISLEVPDLIKKFC